MVDVDRRTPSQTLALRRLSTRATTIPSSPTPGLLSFASSSSAILSHLSATNSLLPALSPSDFARIESTLNFSFPPDLRSLLSLALPASFPSWHSPKLQPLFDLPLAVASLAVARGHLWPSSWGPARRSRRPLLLARSAIRRAPVLIPLIGRFYLPASPNLAGNPVFYVDDDRIFCVANNLQEFFLQDVHMFNIEMILNRSPPKSARWIEFWSDAASDRRRRISSSSSDASSSSPKRAPEWVGEFLGRMGSVLRDGGWGDDDVSEMVEGTAAVSSCDGREEWAVVDEEVVMDELFVRGERLGEELRRAGWRSGEFDGDLCFDMAKWRQKERRRAEVRLPEGMVGKMGEIAQAVGVCL